ncbi:hypothetical protein SAMN00777080_1348 [Aquiflexum balticum DSM 16537]|uniref:Uncharacterized protein n=1 Tax=Aquiflexum balticum DSM 16537 TaxID=758820 RepID=A0A1W2H1J5_9BACT|nr:DUF6090 family protein [Aquiflexum balticum]SMD42783.1 hypothetical protein SAMN00777080_1348 [Aquiflexum balticum DSM 16537]
MISFFRKIRQKLLEGNKTANYLKYAAGEIFLVVIGILIALQVNNWNEDRKALRSEEQFLKNIKSELIRDKEYLRKIKDLAHHKIQLFEQLKTKLPDIYYTDKPLLDSLMREYFINLETFFPLTGTFDAGVSGNEISSYRNEVLKTQVFNLYNASYGRLNRYRDIMIDRWDYFVRSYSYERFSGQLGQMDEKDLEKLQGDLAYITKMFELYLQRLTEADLEIQRILDEEN